MSIVILVSTNSSRGQTRAGSKVSAKPIKICTQQRRLTMSDMDISAVRGHAQALKFVEKGGAELSNILASIATAKEAERRGPLQVFVFLAEHFTDAEGVHSIPVPGSKKGETGNLPYDKYTTKIKTNDGERSVPGSWYTDVIKNTAECKAIDERIAQCAGGEGVPEDIARMGDGERKMEVKRLRDRIKDMRTALVKGAM